MVFAPLCLAACLATAAPQGFPAVARTPVTWLIVVDDLHLEFRNTGRLRDLLRNIANELIVEGDRFAITSTGPSSMTMDLTEDRQLLTAEIKKATGNALKHDDVVAAPYGAAEARYRASIAVTTALSLLNNLSQQAVEPKAVLFISNGYDFEILPDRAPGPPSRDTRMDVARAQIRKQLDELTASAARNEIKIFTIDPRFGFADPAAAPGDPAWPVHQDAKRSVLRSIAEATGGMAIEGDLVEQLALIAEKMRPR